VQGTLEQAIGQISGVPIRVHGAGRTDTGVHASGQVVHFDATWSLPTESLASALNVLLPPDLAVRDAEEASVEFHARFDATSRTYRYAVLNRPSRSALLARFAHHERRPLDVVKMAEGARELIGSHDFAAFGAPEEPGRSTVRTVDRFAVRKHRDAVLVSVRGNAFLRSQVRAMVGTLLLVGREKLRPDDVRRIRQSRSRANCPALAPAKGLCLVRVDYDGIRFGARGIEENEDLFGQAE
jgi:tRNA pseudouridine38-40 synthase